ncbi:hypothetical protein DERP_014416 [Dermatophagoides pteronyssinus]|uniref:Sema domain-containing protein n=1 Tax=Dermatophagoides pteronyssinus TaxID=6956 RepID=A0ABQ8J5W0_DERPT|nr:hypothetical protein DERP_014416 [Dermatophagoides pteronyssinus]
MFIIIHQITTTLQKNNIQKRQLQSTIPCGTKYLNETIGLSITNNYLYQFLFIDDTIEIIRYDYQKSIINNDKNNDYKLNLIDGQMLANGLEDLIPLDIVEQLMTVIDWIDEEEELNMYDYSDESPIISMAISINKQGKIHIYCVKTFDEFKYYVGHYNQEIDMNKVDKFYSVDNVNHIMGTISNQNNGIIISFYNQLSSFSLDMIKVNEKYNNDTDYEWIKALVVDSNLNFLYEIFDYPNEQQRKTFTKSFSQIFGHHKFTYGFIDDNQIFLFANQDEKLLTFSSNFTRNQNDSNQKYPFKLQSFKDFFHCNRPLDPVKIDDNKQTTISTTLTTTVKPKSSSTKHDDSTTMKTTVTSAIHPLSTTTTKSPNIITSKSNDSITTTTTTTTDEPSIDEEHSTLSIIIIIITSIIILILLIFIGLIIYYIRKKSTKKIKSQFVYKFPSRRYRLENLSKKQFNLDVDNLSSISSISPTSTMMSEKLFQDSSISNIPPSSTTMMNEKLLPYLSISPISTSETSKVDNISEILYE